MLLLGTPRLPSASILLPCGLLLCSFWASSSSRPRVTARLAPTAPTAPPASLPFRELHDRPLFCVRAAAKRTAVLRPRLLPGGLQLTLDAASLLRRRQRSRSPPEAGCLLRGLSASGPTATWPCQRVRVAPLLFQSGAATGELRQHVPGGGNGRFRRMQTLLSSLRLQQRLRLEDGPYVPLTPKWPRARRGGEIFPLAVRQRAAESCDAGSSVAQQHADG